MNDNKFKNAADFIEDILEDGEALEALKQQMQSRQLVKAFAMLRVERGKTQKDIADVMGQTQGKISRLENGVDADLKISDIESYARATDTEVTLLLSDRNQSLVARVKHHAFEIQKALMELTELAHKDDEIATGVARFHVEAFCNITRLVANAAKNLPRNNGIDDVDYIRIVEGFSTHDDSGDSVKHDCEAEELTQC